MYSYWSYLGYSSSGVKSFNLTYRSRQQYEVKLTVAASDLQDFKQN